MVSSVVGASFAEDVAHLMITQGVLYGIGGAVMYAPFVICLGEWFEKRKGLAFGLLWAGTGISGACVPLIMEFGLNAFGFRMMLRAWGVAAVSLLPWSPERMLTEYKVLIVSPCIMFMKGRIPLSSLGTPFLSNIECFRSPAFWILQSGNVIQGLGYFLPSIYLPSMP